MYKKIEPAMAKKMIDSGSVTVVDVREEDELSQGYIDGSVLVPLSNFENEVTIKLADRNAVYLIYCRSGRRSAIAAEMMIKAGYKNVYDFGGIIDWPFDIVM